MVTEPIRQWNRLPTDEDLAIGPYGPSGQDNLWRVADILTDDPLLVFYPDGQEFEVRSAEDWHKLPSVGLQIIVYQTSCWNSEDEYLYHGEDPKYGLMLPEHDYRVIWHTAWKVIHQRAADKKRLESGD
jgi:hypothetical protein